ncbi:SYF2 splicing factor-domain-containing protein [Microdochium trichocladiopsis]|uniref:Pre-mRNA-splicing factor SYF2 n=1 Tax=Microdochium trichocladiopsis TaxID=1682393 RepID=A0A9P8YJG6_9PEZI|nr:SYF2 splicing factor-domain-containing protein [Microdochium trichocladiopsis]KAH7041138.1 SYF2 splicing factor-domain-containing protein [Microdochium trichocladiopsis]
MPPRKRKTAAAARAEAAAAEIEKTQAEEAPAPVDAATEPLDTKMDDDASQTQQAAAESSIPSEAGAASNSKPEPSAELEPTDTAAAATSSSSTTSSKPETTSKPTPTTSAADRMARFRALQARAKSSSDQNLAEATKETQRLASDPSALTALNRRRDIAAHKLLKADTEDAGGDFERKRAWDWTVEESERWDKRLKKKGARRDDNAFQDYRAESSKVYKRQVREMAAGSSENMARYEKDKMAAIEKAAASGGLDIVETDDGELIAVDKDGTFYSTADSTGFVENRPDRAAVDRLVADMKKAEEARLRKRRERMAQNGDDGDVTYINEKNKQFNQKLNRFYNKYTAEIRDSFERGTMI